MPKQHDAAQLRAEVAAFDAMSEAACNVPLTEFRIWLQRELAEQNVAPRDIAETINASHQTVYRTLGGTRNVMMSTVARLSHALGFNVHLVFERRTAQA